MMSSLTVSARGGLPGRWFPAFSAEGPKAQLARVALETAVGAEQRLLLAPTSRLPGRICWRLPEHQDAESRSSSSWRQRPRTGHSLQMALRSSPVGNGSHDASAAANHVNSAGPPDFAA
jgi:hypothetical protein